MSRLQKNTWYFFCVLIQILMNDKLFSFHSLPSVFVLPFFQITMTASIYNTIAIAAERYLSIKDLQGPAKPFPVR